MKRRLRVEVQPGMFKSERTVSFEAGGRRYVLMVDEEDVKDGTLAVYVVDQQGDEALVDLPRDTFSSGSRIRIPNSALLPA
jgi:hypothetical protein